MDKDICTAEEWKELSYLSSLISSYGVGEFKPYAEHDKELNEVKIYTSTTPKYQSKINEYFSKYISIKDGNLLVGLIIHNISKYKYLFESYLGNQIKTFSVGFLVEIISKEENCEYQMKEYYNVTDNINVELKFN